MQRVPRSFASAKERIARFLAQHFRRILRSLTVFRHPAQQLAGMVFDVLDVHTHLLYPRLHIPALCVLAAPRRCP